jgi:hypothetical protein
MGSINIWRQPGAAKTAQSRFRLVRLFEAAGNSRGHAGITEFAVARNFTEFIDDGVCVSKSGVI